MLVKILIVAGAVFGIIPHIFGGVTPIGAASDHLVTLSQEVSVKYHAFRVKPGQDLKQEIAAYVKAHDIRAGWIVSCVGSLTRLRLRLANVSEPTLYEGYFEIVSATGTLSPDGLHLHISASDQQGRTLGGHLVDGNRVYTTVEVVLGESRELEFRRVLDTDTGSLELQVLEP